LGGPSISTKQQSSAAPAEAAGSLSPEELYRLTLFKWRYTLEAAGFNEPQVPALLFLKWLHATGRVSS